MKKILHQSDSKATLQIHGDVNLVIDGAVKKSNLQPIKKNQFRYALGLGTFSGEQHLGEALIFESLPYVTWMEKKKAKTETHSQIQSPYLMGIGPKETPALIFHQKWPFPTSLQHFYKDLEKQFPLGFAVAGHACCRGVHATHIKIPPIHKENIFEDAEKYWGEEEIHSTGLFLFFGVNLPAAALKGYLPKLVSKGFYTNPLDKKQSNETNHTHGILLKDSPPIATESFSLPIQEAKPLGVRHLYVSSQFQEGMFAVYDISQIN